MIWCLQIKHVKHVLEKLPEDKLGNFLNTFQGLSLESSIFYPHFLKEGRKKLFSITMLHNLGNAVCIAALYGMASITVGKGLTN